MGKTINNFFLLLWKDFLMQWRHPIQTVIEIIIPAVFAIILVVLRSAAPPESHSAKLFSPFEFNAFPSGNDRSEVWWYPSTKNLSEVVSEASIAINKLNINNRPKLEFKNFTDASEVYNHYIKHQNNLYNLLAVIEFNGLYATEFENNNHKAEIRFRFPAELVNGDNWKTDRLYPVFQTQGPRNWRSNDGGFPNYNDERFLILEKELSLAFINHINEEKEENILDGLKLSLERFHYPKWTEDPLLEGLETAIGSFIMLSFVYTCISTVKVITNEKEKQLKEAMKIMGLSNWLHWTAWFIKSFTILLISSIVMIVLLKVKWYPSSDLSVFTHSDASVILVFLLLYISATITFSFAISVFFSKANTAAIVAGILWFLTYSPFTFISSQYESIGLATKLLSSLLLNTAMGFGFKIFLTFEGLEEGIQWSNIWTPTTPDDTLVLGHLMLMLILDTFLYLLIALYVEVVFPGEYGVPQPFYFMFTKSYWGTNTEEITSFESEPNPNYETEPTHLEPSIQLNNLCKKYPKHMAVKNLSLNIYQDQITVLLGHNGAGKTTTMSMLSGMIPPTSGTALINGYSIQKNMKKIRESFGLCPQHNILFDDLTVKEHIYFYSKLKGLTKKDEITQEIEKFIKLLQFESKANSKSVTLSGGMKRKLSVAIALCGNSKVVMCDEPTAGIDPNTRRALWDFLKTEKKGRTILLTTHFMDEADLLGDRIVIMSNGQLQCCGSSFFLKKRYGTGYKLIMDISENCNVEKVTSVLQKFIPNLQETSKIGSELIYTLSEDYVPYFESMLGSLEVQCNDLGVLSYGISLTTLEEVFMKVGDIDRHNNDVINNTSEEINKNVEVKVDGVVDTTVEFGNYLLLGWSLWWNQVLAMAMKKSLSSYRSWILFLIQTLIPAVFLSVAIIMARSMGGLKELPNLKFDLNSYNNPVAVLTSNDVGFTEFANAYRNILKDNLIDWGNQDMGEKMLNETAAKRSEVRKRYIAGATFNNKEITAWFNNDPYHALPLSLQLILNSILQVVKEGYSFEFHNHPLPYTAETKMNYENTKFDMGFQMAFNLGFSLAFSSAFYTMFYIKERASKAKHLQFVSGITLSSFWNTAYICDFLSFILTSALIIITLAIVQEDGFRTADELGRVLSVLLIFGFAMLPLMYLASLCFDVAASGFSKISLINIVMGGGLLLTIQILKALEFGIADFLNNLMLFFPHYSLCTSLQDLLSLNKRKSYCSGLNRIDSQMPFKNNICEQVPDYYDFQSPGIGRNILFSVIGGFIFIIILVIIENGTFSSLKYKICNRTSKSVVQFKNKDDDDVLREKQKVDEFSADDIKNYAVVMKNISKYFKSIAAVNELSLAISKYECFGLLGVNGAGKTTTFKLLTGDIKNFDGNAWINGLSLRTDMKKIYKSIGYCPQFDALLDDLTCKENLIMFGLIRGLTLTDSKLEADKLSTQFDFHQHLHKKVKELSGGNKRKLSTSIALIGNPLVVYLDEPTTGMDPATKRFLWNVLCKIRDSGKCIVLTSHSMDECEALCTRLAIMVNGEFMCLGSTQHLKSKYSNGYLLTIKLKRNENYNEIDDSELEAVNNFVKDKFLNVEIQEKHTELITFSINDKTKTWSKMFGILEKAKEELNIEDYFIGQNSLEQIFISFAKKQIVDPNKDNDKKRK